MASLFDPVQIGAWNLPNRLVMAPLTRCRASEGRVPNALMAEYYRQRATAGLILSEATSINPMAVGYPDTPGIWSDAQVEGWKAITRAVHEAGGKILLQLWHVGRVSDPYYLNGETPVSSSALAASGHVSLLRPQRPYVTPRALRLDEIPGIIADYKRGAENAQRAGFDGVELHGANGYLLNQFLYDGSNVRTDEYGGSIENRARLMTQAVDAAISVWGADRVGLHLSPSNYKDKALTETNPAAVYTHVAKEMAKRKIAFIFTRENDHAEKLGPLIKKTFGGPLIANESFTRDTAEAYLRSGEADAVGFGKLYIANPDLAHRFAWNAPLNTPEPKTFFAQGTTGYTDYPALG